MTHKHLALALIPIIGASVLLWGCKEEPNVQTWRLQSRETTNAAWYNAPIEGSGVWPKMGETVRLKSGYWGTSLVTTVTGVMEVGNRSQTGVLVYCEGIPGLDSWWVMPVIETNYPVQWNTNLPPPQSLMIGDSQIFTNIAISNDYKGTIQIGSNFATAKELSVWMAILDSITRTPEDGTTNAWPTKQTYTVNVADGLWTHTNVIEIHTCSEFCTRMRYVENGLTNDFHVAFTGYTVITNSP